MLDRETNHNCLDLFFIHPDEHSKDFGYSAWCAIEALHPETKVGRPVRHILKSATFISMSINAVFKLWSFITGLTPIPIYQRKNAMTPDLTKCSDL